MMRMLAASLVLAALAAAPVHAGERTVRSGDAPCADTSVGRTVCGAQVRTARSGEPSADVPADLRVDPAFFSGGEAGGVGDEPVYVSPGRVVVVVGAHARASASASARVRVGGRVGCGCR